MPTKERGDKWRAKRKDPAATFTPTMRHWEYLFQLQTLLASGDRYSLSTWARAMGRNKNAARDILRQNPGMRRWVHEYLTSHQHEWIGAVMTRLAGLALTTGSTAHIRLYLEASGQIGQARAAQPQPGVQVNFVGMADHVGQGVAIADWPGGVLEDGRARDQGSSALDPLTARLTDGPRGTH